MKMKVAVFKTPYRDRAILEEWAEKFDDYIRLSDYVDIEFKPLQDKPKIERKISDIEKKIEAISKNAHKDIAALESEKQELLALEYAS